MCLNRFSGEASCRGMETLSGSSRIWPRSSSNYKTFFPGVDPGSPE